jgi:hypothetical protein
LWSFEWVGTGAVSDVQPGTWRVLPAQVNKFYAGLEELKDRLGITDSADDSSAQMAIQSASAWINEYCIVPETPVLTADLRWVPAGTLQVGDELVGVDEFPVGGRAPKRHYRPSVVAAVPRRMAACTKITLEDGREVITAANHRWLGRSNTGRAGATYDWMHACTIQPGYDISAPFTPWPEEDSFEAGWLSGIIDGEGNLHKCGAHTGAHVDIAQNAGAVFDGVTGWLDSAKIPYKIRRSNSDNCLRAEVSERRASMELMGRVRPRRLMPRSAEIWDGGQVTGSVRVVSVESVGVREVVSLGTSTGTYIANGLVSHNCGQHFYRLTETRTYQPHDIWALNIDPLVSVTALNVDTTGNGTFDQAWVLNTDYALKIADDQYNVNAAGVARPFRRVQVLQAGKWFPPVWPYSHLDRVQIIGTWGWPAIPPPVAQATLVLATQWFKEKDAPFGVAGVSDFGVIRVQQNPWVVEQLRPYIHTKRKVGV